jgi:hypothetical protein
MKGHVVVLFLTKRESKLMEPSVQTAAGEGEEWTGGDNEDPGEQEEFHLHQGIQRSGSDSDYLFLL